RRRTLQERLHAGSSALEQRLAEIEVEREMAMRAVVQSRDAVVASTLTEWDESLHEGWDAAESRSYHAVFDTQVQEKALRRRARKQAEQATDKAKRRGAEI